MPDSAPLVGGIEAGGTKFVCAVGRPPAIQAIERFPTQDPKRTLARAADFFASQRQLPRAVGIAAFGPGGCSPRQQDVRVYHQHAQSRVGPHGTWPGALVRALGGPVGFDTDVNGTAIAEHRWGAGRGAEVLLYLTVGTGIGGGALVRGLPVHGLMHPEMGHLFLPRAEGDTFEGICPFHGDCLEGLATGPALAARWGQPAETLPPDHEAWALEAHYLAYAVTNLILAYSPRRVILGGGVMQQTHLFPAIRERVLRHLAGYLNLPAITQHIDTYIVPPELGSDAGVLGAMALALSALRDPSQPRA